jgi:hypothetical protein
MNLTGWFVLLIFVGLIFSVNIALWNLWKGKEKDKRSSTFELLYRAGKQMKEDPWKQENDNMKELSRRVEELRPSPTEKSSEEIL